MSQLPAVLIADDDDVFLTVIESMVQMLGYPVLTAHDGIEAITVFKKHAKDIGCVMLDIQMPRMNGVVTLRHLREMGENVPVIIASGYLDDTNLKQLEALNPAGYLQKPVFFQALSGLLTKCLANAEPCDLEHHNGRPSGTACNNHKP
jgi:CheY-like chemotaxis protein